MIGDNAIIKLTLLHFLNVLYTLL